MFLISGVKEYSSQLLAASFKERFHDSGILGDLGGDHPWNRQKFVVCFLTVTL